MAGASHYYTTVFKSLLALVLVLNALGWAAHVDMPGHVGGAQFAHTHANATQQAAGQATDASGGTAYSSDHCGHADAHFAGLILRLDPAIAPGVGRLQPSRAAHYVSLSSAPPLEPPIV